MLTNREKEILEFLSKGLMYKEIASQLFLSPETVRKHVYHIYEKLHVTNRVAAVNKFYGDGFAVFAESIFKKYHESGIVSMFRKQLIFEYQSGYYITLTINR